MAAGATLHAFVCLAGRELAPVVVPASAPEPEPEVDSLLDGDDLPVPPVPQGEEPSAPPTPEEDSEPKSRTVQQDCSQCQQRFEVTLPEGHDIARTACPSCGAIETIRLT